MNIHTHIKNFHTDMIANFTYTRLGYVGSLWLYHGADFGRMTYRTLLQTRHQTLQ